MKLFAYSFALLSSLVAVLIIHKVTVALYFVPDNSLTILKTCQLLWASNDYFLRFILFINYIFKPAFVFFTTYLFVTSTPWKTL